MNSTRMRFGFLVLAVYAALGVIGVYSKSPAPVTAEVCAADAAVIASAGGDSERRRSSDGGSEVEVQWHSFLPGAFK